MAENRISQEDGLYKYRCSNGREFIFDECDLPFFEKTVCTADKRGYVTANRKKNLISHLLLGVSNDVIVDHVNGNPFDNRRCNLRIASNAQNHWNYRLSARNTTGFKGIYKDKSLNKYHARICENGKRHYLGAYDSPEQAACAYDAAAREYFGEYATLNFPEVDERCCIQERGKCEYGRG